MKRLYVVVVLGMSLASCQATASTMRPGKLSTGGLWQGTTWRTLSKAAMVVATTATTLGQAAVPHAADAVPLVESDVLMAVPVEEVMLPIAQRRLLFDSYEECFGNCTNSTVLTNCTDICAAYLNFSTTVLPFSTTVTNDTESDKDELDVYEWLAENKFGSSAGWALAWATTISAVGCCLIGCGVGMIAKCIRKTPNERPAQRIYSGKELRYDYDEEGSDSN